MYIKIKRIVYRESVDEKKKLWVSLHHSKTKAWSLQLLKTNLYKDKSLRAIETTIFW